MVTAAVIISLIAGILIVLASVYPTIAGTWTILVAVSGVIVLLSAVMLKIRPGESTQGLRMCCLSWGSLILVFSIVSLFGIYMGGFFIGSVAGSILGIIGAALALVAKV
jgi:hypothetical protein